MTHRMDSESRVIRMRPVHRWTHTLWNTAVHDEWLIDLAEWEQTRGVSTPEVTRIAFTRQLWDTMARFRFKDLGKVRFEDRLAAVLGPARVALDRVLKLAEDLSPPGEVIDFTARLASRSTEREQRMLRLHVELGPFEHPFATVGLAHEFVRHPLESLASKLV
jgi:hypothetical protein